MQIRNFLVLFLVLKGSLCSSQENKEAQPVQESLYFHLLNVSSGLSHNFINDIKQDSLGFIWIASLEGLNRYDGNNFVHFKKHLETPSEGIANNYIQQLEIDSSGKLLIATDAGLNIYNPETENFKLIDSEKGLLNNSVSCIAKGPNGSHLVGTYRGGVQLAKENWKMELLDKYISGNENLSSIEISSIKFQNDSILWIGTFDNGLNKVNLQTGKVYHLFSEENNGGQVINTLYEDVNRNLWIGTRKGLQVISETNDIIHISKATSGAKGLSDDDVLCFEEDAWGNMWIGTRNGGLNILDPSSLFNQQDNLQIDWYLPANDGSSVFNRTVSVITMDSDLNMWLGTPTGINYVNPGGEVVKCLKHNRDKESISHNRIGALAQARDNKIWIGTDGAGLNLYDPQTGNFRNYRHDDRETESLSNDYILTVLLDSKDRLWVGTYRGGLNKLDPETGRSRHYLQGSVSEGSDVRYVFEADNGNIWVGTNRGGLYEYVQESDSFQYIEELGEIDVRCIDSDVKGNLWLATFGSGLIKYNPENGEYNEYNRDNTKGFKSDIIFSNLILPNGKLLLGTRYGGLLSFDPKTGKILNCTEKEGLSNNTVNSLIQEDETNIWMGTYNGISRYNLKTNEIVDFSSLNNIQEGEFNIGAALKSNSGELYFGGNNGLNILSTRLFESLGNDYPLVFEGLKVLNESVKVNADDEKSILEKSILYQDSIKLKHNQNSFSIEFAALKYPAARNLTYSYKLENFNDYWIEAQETGIANFTNVPPGEYTLKVKTNSGYEGEAYKELDIHILPPIWQTWPAYLLYVLGGGLVIWIASKYYSERINLKNSLVFEKKQRQLEQDLNEERVRFFSAFSHELKTPLTLILAPVENLLSETQNKKLKSELVYIRKNAGKLHRSINRLLEFRKAEEGLSQLNRKEHELTRNLRKWIENYLPLAKEKNISLEYSLPVDKKFFQIDLEKIEVIVNNLLSNAIKYCKKGGEVKVTLICSEKEFKIAVSDTGTGINPEELSQIFDWYYRSNSNLRKNGTGIGLALSQRFAELHRGIIKAKCTAEKKTIFTLTIPEVEIKNSTEKYLEVDKNGFSEPSEIFEAAKPNQQIANLTSGKDKKLIVIIDDNEEILSFLTRIFKEDYDLVLARDGREGILKASKYVPDLIISDVMMPEKSGIDVCAELKAKHSTSHIPIILLTAKSNVDSIKAGYQKGADDYITKPFNPQLLKTRVENLLRSRQRLQDFFKARGGVPETEEEKELELLTNEKKFLSEFDRIVMEHIAKGTDNVDLISQEIGMSRTSLYRKLKAITGYNINGYIRNLKIERAAFLIKDENYSVSQASYEVGFNNIKYFRKVFKEKFGKTPSEFKI